MPNNKPILVVGGGISGMTSALEAAEVGYEVIIIESSPYFGGRVSQMNKYFPKLCPPYCGLEINFRRIKTNPRITYYTTAQIKAISGEAGSFKVDVNISPRYVNNKCTACDECVKVCPVERKDDYNMAMTNNKAIYMSHKMAFPAKYAIDSDVCKFSECNKCVDVCKYDAIDFGMQSKTISLDISSIIYATGWRPYDATKMDNLGFGQYENIITNIMMERLAASNGPTGGKVVRPSDGKEAKNVVFVQCAGSRDENHLPYCSSICCMASLKQSTFVREQYEDSKVHIFYIDLRTPGKYEKFLSKIRDDENISFTKGKVAKVSEDSKTKNIIVEAEDTIAMKKVKVEADLVVLATGMEPSSLSCDLPSEVKVNDIGFMSAELQGPGIYAVGVGKQPVDVMTSVQDCNWWCTKGYSDYKELTMDKKNSFIYMQWLWNW